MNIDKGNFKIHGLTYYQCLCLLCFFTLFNLELCNFSVCLFFTCGLRNERKSKLLEPVE